MEARKKKETVIKLKIKCLHINKMCKTFTGYPAS